MGKTVVYLKKSNKPDKKYMVWVDGKTIHFGARGMSDYTKHKDKKRMGRYTARHKRGGETWNKKGIKTAGFWSKWLLWNKPSIGGSKRDIASKFGITFRSGWPKKGSTKKGVRKGSRKSKRRSRKGARRRSRKSKRRSRRRSRKSKRRSRRRSRTRSRKSKRRSRRKSRMRIGGKRERCVLKVKSKQKRKCFSRSGKWKGGKGCYNPWAVCSKLKPRQAREKATYTRDQCGRKIHLGKF